MALRRLISRPRGATRQPDGSGINLGRRGVTLLVAVVVSLFGLLAWAAVAEPHSQAPGDNRPAGNAPADNRPAENRPGASWPVTRADLLRAEVLTLYRLLSRPEPAARHAALAGARELVNHAGRAALDAMKSAGWDQSMTPAVVRAYAELSTALNRRDALAELMRRHDQLGLPRVAGLSRVSVATGGLVGRGRRRLLQRKDGWLLTRTARRVVILDDWFVRRTFPGRLDPLLADWAPGAPQVLVRGLPAEVEARLQSARAERTPASPAWVHAWFRLAWQADRAGFPVEAGRLLEFAYWRYLQARRRAPSGAGWPSFADAIEAETVRWQLGAALNAFASGSKPEVTSARLAQLAALFPAGAQALRLTADIARFQAIAARLSQLTRADARPATLVARLVLQRAEPTGTLTQTTPAGTLTPAGALRKLGYAAVPALVAALADLAPTRVRTEWRDARGVVRLALVAELAAQLLLEITGYDFAARAPASAGGPESREFWRAVQRAAEAWWAPLAQTDDASRLLAGFDDAGNQRRADLALRYLGLAGVSAADKRAALTARAVQAVPPLRAELFAALAAFDYAGVRAWLTERLPGERDPETRFVIARWLWLQDKNPAGVDAVLKDVAQARLFTTAPEALGARYAFLREVRPAPTVAAFAAALDRAEDVETLAGLLRAFAIAPDAGAGASLPVSLMAAIARRALDSRVWRAEPLALVDGGPLCQSPRVGDLAGFALATALGEPGAFIWEAPRAQREEQRVALVNRLRKSRGQAPLAMPFPRALPPVAAARAEAALRALVDAPETPAAVRKAKANVLALGPGVWSALRAYPLGEIPGEAVRQRARLRLRDAALQVANTVRRVAFVPALGADAALLPPPTAWRTLGRELIDKPLDVARVFATLHGALAADDAGGAGATPGRAALRIVRLGDGRGVALSVLFWRGTAALAPGSTVVVRRSIDTRGRRLLDTHATRVVPVADAGGLAALAGALPARLAELIETAPPHVWLEAQYTLRSRY